MILLSATFFGFVDDRYRGWEDTNQYQLEARAWTLGSRPPVKELIAEKRNINPAYTPPLVPYSWFLITDSRSETNTLWRIRIFQALLLGLAFSFFVPILEESIGLGAALVWGVLLFFTEFIRQLVMVPQTEPLSVALLILAYWRPSWVGVLAALEAVVRPPVVVLFGPLLWKQRKSWKVALSGAVTLAILILHFRNLFVPATFAGMGFNKDHIVDGFGNLISDSAFLYFDHLLPYKSLWLKVIWGLILGALLTTTVIKNRRNVSVWIFALAYTVVILLPLSQGLRYFFPLILLFMLEFKPSWPRPRWVQALIVILILHLGVRHIESFNEFRRDRTPETDSIALNEAKRWLIASGMEKEIVMMNHHRFCINFFKTQCFVLTPGGDIYDDLKAHSVHFVLLTGRDWQIEEPEFEKRFLAMLRDRHLEAKITTRGFSEVRLIDVSGI